MDYPVLVRTGKRSSSGVATGVNVKAVFKGEFEAGFAPGEGR